MISKRRGNIPKGRISYKKEVGGYSVNIKGKMFDEVTDKRSAKSSVKRIQKLREEDKKKRRR